MSDSRPPNEPREPTADRGRDRTLPILLIVGGLALLLGRLGLFDWSLALGVLQLWPLLLIALGADLLTRGRYRLPIVIVAVALGALLYRAPGWLPVVGGGAAEAHELAYERGDAREGEIELSHGLGRLTLDALPRGSELMVGGEIATGARERLRESFEVRGGVARLTLETRQRGPTFGFRGGDRHWSLQLARDLPLDLDLNSGVGDAFLDLRALTLHEFELDSGVGEVRLTLPDGGGYEARIDAGVGDVLVRIPHGVEARVVADSGIGGTEVTGDWIRNGDVHVSPGYGDAGRDGRVDLRIDGGVGTIRVERVD